MNETLSIVCIRVGDEHEVYEPSVKRYCHKCGHEVWVAPSSIELLAASDAARLTCVVCAGISFDSPPPPNSYVTVGTLREVAEWRRKKGKT